jgi:7-carboxy-7-deazaguanine synthase
MRITEIFFSIQGESSYAGRPCVFVRLTGCPLRCTWCDTAYAFHGGTERRLESILAEVERHECRLVEITGGEPLAQSEVHGLITALADRGYTVLIETSGALDISPVDPRAILIMDLKCPGSGMEDRNLWANIPKLKPTDEVKFVIKDREDYEWAVATIREHALTDAHTVLLSPVFGELDPRTLAEWVLADRLPIRLQLQLHKLIWDPEMRGV